MMDPKPGDLDQGCPKARIARFGDALLSIDLAALPWRRR